VSYGIFFSVQGVVQAGQDDFHHPLAGREGWKSIQAEHTHVPAGVTLLILTVPCDHSVLILFMPRTKQSKKMLHQDLNPALERAAELDCQDRNN
jgi:hypothetical protein